MLIKRSALKQIALFFLTTTFAFLMDKQYKRGKLNERAKWELWQLPKLKNKCIIMSNK